MYYKYILTPHHPTSHQGTPHHTKLHHTPPFTSILVPYVMKYEWLDGRMQNQQRQCEFVCFGADAHSPGPPGVVVCPVGVKERPGVERFGGLNVESLRF